MSAVSSQTQNFFGQTAPGQTSWLKRPTSRSERNTPKTSQVKKIEQNLPSLKCLDKFSKIKVLEIDHYF